MVKLFIIRKYNSREVYLVRETQVLSEYFYIRSSIVKFYYKKKLTNKIIRHLIFNENYYRKSILHNSSYYYQYSQRPLTKEEVLDAFCFSEDKFYINEYSVKKICGIK